MAKKSKKYYSIAKTLPQCLDQFEPFISAIKDGKTLLNQLNKLSIFAKFDNNIIVVRHIFVKLLGYKRIPSKSSNFVISQKKFRRFVAIAEHDKFTISIAQIDSGLRFTSIYHSVFKVFPYGLCIVIDPVRRIVRFVYTHGSAKKRKIGYRMFLGQSNSQAQNDNIIVWAKRLDLIRPQEQDDCESLRDRVSDAMRASPADLSYNWESRDLAPKNLLPGPTWQDLPRIERDSFLQKHQKETIHWGLEAVFRDRFPMVVIGGKKKGLLSYERYKITSEGKNVQVNGTNGITLNLFLRLRSFLSEKELKESLFPEKIDLPIKIPCFLPISDEKGVFVINWQSYLFIPMLGGNGSLAPRFLHENDRDLSERLNENFSPSIAISKDPNTYDKYNLDSNEEIENENVVDIYGDGASIRAMLEVAVSRKLAALANRLWRLREETKLSLEGLVPALLPLSNAQGFLQLGSIPFLLQSLTKLNLATMVQQPRCIIQHPNTVITTPPVWACLDSSASTEYGKWHVISGARLHPTGMLAVPIQKYKKLVLTVTNKSARALNQRTLQNCFKTTLPKSWWIAPALKHWAELNIGKINFAELAWRKGFFVSNEQWIVSSTSFERFSKTETCSVCEFNKKQNATCSCDKSKTSFETRLFITPSYLEKIQREQLIKRSINLTVPKTNNNQKPRQALSSGDVVTPAQTWLFIDKKTWSVERDLTPKTITSLTGVLDEDASIEQFVERIPVDWKGLVLENNSFDFLGGMGNPVAFQNQLIIGTIPTYQKAILPDGRIVSVVVTAPENMPFDRKGNRINVALSDSESRHTRKKSPFFAGHSTKEITYSLDKGKIAWIPTIPEKTPTFFLKYRILDNAPIPDKNVPSLSENERFWLRIAYPKIARKLELADSRGEKKHANWEPLIGAILNNFKLEVSRPFVAKKAVIEGSLQKTTKQNTLLNLVKTSIFKFSVDRNGNLGGFIWRCKCGELFGPENAQDKCKICDTFVKEYLDYAKQWKCSCGNLRHQKALTEACQKCGTQTELERISRNSADQFYEPLPIFVLHPWKIKEIATLIAVTLEEMQTLISMHDPTTIRDLVLLASKRPWLTMKKRITTASENTFKQLGEQLFHMEQQYGSLRNLAQKVDSFFLHEVPSLPFRFFASGFPPGAPHAVHSQLLDRYKELRLAIEQTEDLLFTDSPLLRASTQIALQKTVMDLYGCPDKKEIGISSFAQLLARQWPLSRNGALPTTVFGLGQTSENLYLQDITKKNAKKMIIPRPLRAFGSPDSIRFWKDKYALHALNNLHLKHIVGALMGLNSLKKNPFVEDLFLQDGLKKSDDIALLCAQAAVQTWNKASTKQYLLLDLLVSPLVLPKSWKDASNIILSSLYKAIQNNDFISTITRTAFLVLLGGWWKSKPTTKYPLGWRIEPLNKKPYKPWERAIPPLNSNAWQMWPNIMPFIKPINWLISSSTKKHYLKNMIGNNITPPKKHKK